MPPLLSALKFKGTSSLSGIHLYTLSTATCKIQITNFGLKIVGIQVPDKNGSFRDVVLGFTTLKEYLDTDEVYFGAVIGRFANRICKGKFNLNGTAYQLEINNPPNHLHGGSTGFHNCVWDCIKEETNKLTFVYESAHMEEGYPGNLAVEVTYELTSSDTLIITYKAKTDQTTLINLTNHSYFNLNGEHSSTVLDHLLKINASFYTPIDKSSIPLGSMDSVRDTPFDFLKFKKIGADLNLNNVQLNIGKGYDHNFVIDTKNEGKKLIKIAEVYSENSGISLSIETTEPGVQLYTGNFLNGTTKGKSGNYYQQYGAFCLETQHFPDSPNQPHFPTTVLQPDEVFESTTTYTFSQK